MENLPVVENFDFILETNFICGGKLIVMVKMFPTTGDYFCGGKSPLVHCIHARTCYGVILSNMLQKVLA